jgi:ethanolamine utilization protein EutM
MEQSLGIIETLGFATAMEAADAAVKSANVKVGEWVTVGGGKVNVILRGDIAAVKAAVEAGVVAASQIGKVEGQVIIPRPSDALSPMFPIVAKK